MIHILIYIMTGGTLIGSLLNAKKLRMGFNFWTVSNAFWLIRYITIGEYALAIAFAFNMCILVYGFICRGKQGQTDTLPDNPQDNTDLCQTAFDDDLFYVRENQGNVQWIYYNPDSNAGGQYVDSVFNCYHILDAAQHEDPADFFDYLGMVCKTWLIDIGTDDFEEYDRQHKEDPYSLKSADADTMARLIAFAKRYEEKYHGK